MKEYSAVAPHKLLISRIMTDIINIALFETQLMTVTGEMQSEESSAEENNTSTNRIATTHTVTSFSHTAIAHTTARNAATTRTTASDCAVTNYTSTTQADPANPDTNNEAVDSSGTTGQ